MAAKERKELKTQTDIFLCVSLRSFAAKFPIFIRRIYNLGNRLV